MNNNGKCVKISINRLKPAQLITDDILQLCDSVPDDNSNEGHLKMIIDKIKPKTSTRVKLPARYQT